MYCDHVERDGESLFRLACENDLEGVLAKRKFDPDLPDKASWLKIGTLTTPSGKAARIYSSESATAILTFHCGMTVSGLVLGNDFDCIGIVC